MATPAHNHPATPAPDTTPDVRAGVQNPGGEGSDDRSMDRLVELHTLTEHGDRVWAERAQKCLATEGHARQLGDQIEDVGDLIQASPSPTPTASLADSPPRDRRLARVMTEEQAARRHAWAEQVAASRAKFEMPSPRHEQDGVDNLAAPDKR